jgi:hypothetical protein
MLKISKYHKAMIGCSAIATATFASFAPSAIAQTVTQTNNSNASGGNVTTITNPSISPTTTSTGGTGGTTGGGFSATTVSRASAVSTRFNTAAQAYDRAAAALAQAETAPPNAANTQPVRYGREAGDLASCGCPNADTVGTNTTPRPELVAAKAAEAEAAAELAKAKAEAREFIESVKNEPKTSAASGFVQIW